MDLKKVFSHFVPNSDDFGVESKYISSSVSSVTKQIISECFQVKQFGSYLL